MEIWTKKIQTPQKVSIPVVLRTLLEFWVQKKCICFPHVRSKWRVFWNSHLKNFRHFFQKKSISNFFILMGKPQKRNLKNLFLDILKYGWFRSFFVIFLKNDVFLINHTYGKTIEKTIYSLEMILWTSKYHFWEVDFWWPETYFNS